MSQPDPEALYVALIGDPARLRKLRRLQYRCATDNPDDRCLLLDAIEVGQTVLLHQKRYKTSPEINERRSSPAGRAKNTFDGLNHWKPRTYYIDSSALAYPDDLPTPQLSIQCDHVGVLPGGAELCITAPEFHRDWNAGHAEVRVRRDGSRYSR